MVLVSDAEWLLRLREYFALSFGNNSKVEPDLHKMYYLINHKK